MNRVWVNAAVPGQYHSWQKCGADTALEKCSKEDGSALSDQYPCLCGTHTCTKGRYCTAATNTCALSTATATTTKGPGKAGWYLCGAGASCNSCCAYKSLTCDQSALNTINHPAHFNAAAKEAGHTCTKYDTANCINTNTCPPLSSNTRPAVQNGRCYYDTTPSATCSATSSGASRLCRCK
eukprot:gnl/TRDRNA2_/TRDRNA2_171422_c2_seq4.p1 gnl/TRDRNA2_/TRDRNA2_171422_c2~~gnl/TRDRNA2_/TRDRNA2_171422_c2_seq4.p1  ORF type:complete len:181 (+),score=5.91 gnl/TRDRNA2_/TRDRNA2_171422_c2_seq4:255-797(+)